MVEKSEVFRKIDGEFELQSGEERYPGEVVLTEGGQLSLRFEEGVIGSRLNLHQSWSEIEGETLEGDNIVVNNATATRVNNGYLTEVKAYTVDVFNSPDTVPGDDTQVAIDFDTVCFQTSIPVINNIDAESRELIQTSEGPDIPEEKEFPYFETGESEVYGVPLTDSKERIEYIEENEHPIRTGKIRVKQTGAGDIRHRIDRAEELVHKILEISQLVQEASPQFIRVEVGSVSGQEPGNYGCRFERLRSGGIANVGGAFTQFPSKVLWGNFSDYLEEAYDNYTPYVRKDLRLQQVLGYYVDARNPKRPVQGKMLSACSAIELFALWHAREDGVSERTDEKIGHVINKLDVDTTDLASDLIEDLTQLNTPEYFWKHGRNHVSHGAPNMDGGELYNYQESTLIVLKRLIRNQLLGSSNSNFEKFYEMEPRSKVNFD